MKCKILIIGASYKATDAVSGIISGITDCLSNDCEVYFCGYNQDAIQLPDGHDISIPNPGYNATLCYRLKIKIFTKLNLEDCMMNLKLILAQLKKYAHLKFDLVIGTSGIFSFMEAAYLFAVKNNIPFRMVYFDPFVSNVLARHPQERKIIEKRWLAYADNLYFNAENTCPAYLQTYPKLKYFYIPIVSRSLENYSRQASPTLIYGGALYPKIREPKLLYDFADSIKNQGFKIECYSPVVYNSKNTDIRFLPMLNRKDFEKRCQQAYALIYIGNTGGKVLSSKYLEYIALHKPIIGINVEPNNEVRKYKYYFDSKDPNLIEKLNNIKQEDLLAYNPFDVFKNRDPKILAETLFK